MIIINFFKKLKLLLKYILIIAIIIFIFIVTLNIYKNHTIPSTDLSKDTINIISQENLIKEFKNVNKIIPLEVELSKTIIIDKSFSSLDIFEKYKEIQFFANCSYYIDLYNLSDDDIILDNSLNTIELKIPYPKIYTINLLNDKTIYKPSKNGLLRFGEIKLTQEEFDIIQKEVYSSFEDSLNSEDLYNEAIENSKKSLTYLLNKLTAKNLTVKIIFK